jgi:uncharacterized membrane protein YcaP (DUF421 family)
MPSLPEIGSSLPEVVLRTAIVYLFLVTVMRISGKREVGQMSVLTLLGLDYALKTLTSRSRRLRTAIEGEPRLLVRDGVILRKALHDEGVEDEELRAALREHGVLRVEDVRLAVLETDGSISVIPTESARG